MAQKLTFEQVKQRFENKGFELLETEYINNHTPMLCKTKEGYLRKIKLNNVDKDVGYKIFEPKNPFTLYNIKLWLHRLSPEIELITSRYVNTKTPLDFRCRVCGHTFTKTIGNLRTIQKVLCPKCWESPKKLSIEEVKERLSEKKLKMLDTEYVANNVPILCEDEYGNQVYIKLTNLHKWSPNPNGYPLYSSNYESLVAYWLKEHEIKFIYQYTDMHCKDQRPLPFDFYVEDFNTIIEVDGEHHFMQLSHRQSLEYIQYHDSIKTQFCKQNNITLLRIPYYCFNSKEEYKVILCKYFL